MIIVQFPIPIPTSSTPFRLACPSEIGTRITTKPRIGLKLFSRGQPQAGEKKLAEFRVPIPRCGLYHGRRDHAQAPDDFSRFVEPAHMCIEGRKKAVGRRSSERPTSDLTAYELYLRALPHCSSLDLARRALQVGPDDPTVLALVAFVLGYFGEDIDVAIRLIVRISAPNWRSAMRGFWRPAEPSHRQQCGAYGNGYSDIAGGSTNFGRMQSAATRSAESMSRPMHRITRAQANPDFSVDLRFEDGRQARVNLSEMIQSAAVASPFRDPARFVRELAIVEDGDVLRWSDQFELHADSLRYRAFPDELVRDYGPQRGNRGRPAA
jgi:hypothetical protein